MTETKRRIRRRTMQPYWKGKKIVVQIGPGDIIKFRYERDRTWMETSINGAMQHAAMVKAETERIEKKKARGGRMLVSRGLLS